MNISTLKIRKVISPFPLKEREPIPPFYDQKKRHKMTERPERDEEKRLVDIYC